MATTSVRNPFLSQANRAQRRTGSGFNNLQRILEANRRSRIGSAVQGGFGRLQEQARGRIGEAESAFTKDAEKKRLDTQANKDIRASALQSVAGGGDPSKEQITQFKKFKAGEYTGPTQLGGLSELQAKGQQIEGLGGAARSGASRLGLLRRFVGGPQYTSGQQGLDRLILGQEGDMLRGLRRQAGTFGRELETRAGIAEQRGVELANRAKQFAQQTQEEIQKARDPFMSAAQKRFDEAKAKEDARQKAIEAYQNQGLQSALGQLQSTGALRGRNASEVQRLLRLGKDAGMNVADQIAGRLTYINPQNLNVQSLATEQERERLNKFAQLASEDPFALSGQAGEYTEGGLRVGDLSDIEQAIDRENIRQWEARTGQIHPSNWDPQTHSRWRY